MVSLSNHRLALGQAQGVRIDHDADFYNLVLVAVPMAFALTTLSHGVERV
jgi:hypothetical protein